MYHRVTHKFSNIYQDIVIRKYLSKNKFPCNATLISALSAELLTFKADIETLNNLNDANLNDLFYDDELSTPDHPKTPKDRSTRPHEIATSSSSSWSWVWEYYSKDSNPTFALCSLCRTKVNCGKDMRIGPLMHHLQRKHDRVYQQHLSSKALLR
jgi:hypothetical protein